MNKKDLRKLYLQKRHDLSPDKEAELNLLILNLFSKLSFEGIKFVHLFYPIIGKHECNSLLLVEWLKDNHPEIKLVLSKSNFLDHSLHNILWQENTPLIMNQWGITEPEHGIEVLSDEIDLVITPLLAFDKQGNRLGYGKGFYDRFLSGCRPNIQKIGISFFEPEERFEDIDAYDVPLNQCITPYQIWDFRRDYS